MEVARLAPLSTEEIKNGSARSGDDMKILNIIFTENTKKALNIFAKSLTASERKQFVEGAYSIAESRRIPSEKLQGDKYVQPTTKPWLEIPTIMPRDSEFQNLESKEVL